MESRSVDNRTVELPEPVGLASRVAGRLALVVILLGVILTASVWYLVVGLPLIAVGVVTWRSAVRSLHVGGWATTSRAALIVMTSVGALLYGWLMIWAVKAGFDFSSLWSWVGFLGATAWTTLALWATGVILRHDPA